MFFSENIVGGLSWVEKVGYYREGKIRLIPLHVETIIP